MTDPSPLIAALRERLGPRVVTTDPERIAGWTTDWRGRWTGRTAALLEPRSTAEVQAIVRAAGDHRVPLVPQGGNSSMVGGATPDASGTALILSLRRMDAVRAIDPERRQVVVEAGMVLETLHARLLEAGLRLPLDLGARGSATLGGLASTNAGGTEVLRHGTMGAMVVGLEAVIAGGELLDTLSPLKKDNRGPRVDRLLVGGEGQFGVITALRLQLVAAPRDRASAWVAVDDPKAALELLRFCEARCGAIEGFELIPADVVAAAVAVMGVTPPIERAAWHVLVEAKGQGDPGTLAGALEAILGDALEAGLARDAVVARSEAQAEAFWRIRHSLSEAEKKHYGMANSHDVSVPVDAMPGFLKEVREAVEARWPGTSVSGYGHLGDGNIHLHVRAMDRACADWRETEGAAIERVVHDMVATHGGSISAEHGIGQMKRGEFARLGEPGRLQMLRALKAALDPAGIFNPGKLLP
ncbi:FAD-binding oxidoreductase [Sphingomicrobium astaxanthinifaciens]|uniref:FAD-binding oxidoreductase n=1 Tax=Sphingomicrobium astaxanthinifaciens TaxID=1227949 RepID=UPI001FCBB596|nr:FAD-binding oxidoreductase [Sphingomicrobium astaxanthinifaciens]MCJ7421736.1 FAD-binding oxidoreductase [Sphingomicrobium astaxanthinifaciens]